MNYFKYLLFIFLVGSVDAHLIAQEPSQTLSVKGQFEDVLKESNNYTSSKGELFEIIRRRKMLTLKANTLDSLYAIQTKLDNSTKQVSTQQNEINTLQTNLAETNDKLTSALNQKNSMTFLGMQISKIGYNLLMWSIIAALSAFLVFFIFMFKNRNAVAKAANSARAHLENEFKEHRRVALEREQKVRRELQDELNKNRG